MEENSIHYSFASLGAIEYEEFAQMMYTLLKCKNDGDMSEDRLQRFWAEIDGDGSGEADFTEFCEFYLKYFMSELSSAKLFLNRG